jgi:hypothetical protein
MVSGLMGTRMDSAPMPLKFWSVMAVSILL